jgi:hypothetical protein
MQIKQLCATGLFVVLGIVWVAPVHAADKPLTAVEQLSADVQGPDVARRKAAVPKMVALLQSDPAAAFQHAAYFWPSFLCAANMPDDCVTVMDTAMKAAQDGIAAKKPWADTKLIAQLLEWKIKALLQANKSQEAADALLNAIAKDQKEGKGQLGKKVEQYHVFCQELVTQKAYDQAIAVAKVGIVEIPNYTDGIAMMQKFRAEALLAENKPAEAVAAAKAYYNVCPLKDTVPAIDLVGRCLQSAHPDDKTIAHTFKKQQATLAAAPAAGAPPATGPAENMLKSIAVDGKEYDEAIATYKAATYPNLIAKGNLLLLADRGAEAEACFKSALALADAAHTAEAQEKIACAMRAADSNVGRANAYVVALANPK